MAEDDERRGQDGPQLVVDDQLVPLELPDLTRVGVVSRKRCTEATNIRVEKVNL